MRFSVKILMVMCFMTFFGGCVTRGMNLREGIKSFQIQNYRQAFIRLLPEAENGQPDAQYAVGYMYYYGQGVIEDRKKAWYWIGCAARMAQRDAVEAMTILQNPTSRRPH